MLSQNNNQPVIVDREDSLALKELILKAKQGDSDAFGAVYQALYVPLYRYIISKCRDNELANDISQQAFLKFYEALSSYEPDKSPLAYLFTIAKRLLINHAEKKDFEQFDESFLETYDDNSVTVLDEVHIKNLSSEINSYLPLLTSDEQEVVRLYYFSEFSYREISNLLDKEEAYIRKIKERSLKKLRILTAHLYEHQ